jgi:hypothetical protein
VLVIWTVGALHVPTGLVTLSAAVANHDALGRHAVRAGRRALIVNGDEHIGKRLIGDGRAESEVDDRGLPMPMLPLIPGLDFTPNISSVRPNASRPDGGGSTTQLPAPDSVIVAVIGPGMAPMKICVNRLLALLAGERFEVFVTDSCNVFEPMMVPVQLAQNRKVLPEQPAPTKACALA